MCPLFAMCYFLGTRQMISLPCARFFSHGKRETHGKLAVSLSALSSPGFDTACPLWVQIVGGNVDVPNVISVYLKNFGLPNHIFENYFAVCLGKDTRQRKYAHSNTFGLPSAFWDTRQNQAFVVCIILPCVFLPSTRQTG